MDRENIWNIVNYEMIVDSYLIADDYIIEHTFIVNDEMIVDSYLIADDSILESAYDYNPVVLPKNCVDNGQFNKFRFNREDILKRIINNALFYPWL